MTLTTLDLRLAGVASPDDLYPGLDDGLAYDVAAVVAGRDALIRHLRDAGCPAPTHPAAIASVLADVGQAVAEAGWSEESYREVDDAIDRIRTSLPQGF